MNFLEAHALQAMVLMPIPAPSHQELEAAVTHVLQCARRVTKEDRDGPRRLVCSLRETYRALPYGVECVVLAYDIVPLSSASYDVLRVRDAILERAAAHNIPCITTMSKYAIGRAFGIGKCVSCVAIANSYGFHYEFRLLLDVLRRTAPYLCKA